MNAGAVDPNRRSPRKTVGRWRKGRTPALIVAAALVSGVATGCGPRELTPVQRGEAVYRTNCISCHNRDPKLPGSLGPPIAGSSRALLEARLLHQSYPPGYVPKRNTHNMRSLPWLAGHVGDLNAYLSGAAKDNRQAGR